jgi:hypothetical protein
MKHQVQEAKAGASQSWGQRPSACENYPSCSSNSAVMNLAGTILVYVALAAIFLGAVSVVLPLRWIGIASRPHAVAALFCGVVCFLIGVNLPAPEKRIAERTTVLDDFAPAYQFAESHTIRIAAPRERVFTAICDVTANEITLFRTLTWIRRFGRPGPQSILNPPPDEPLMAVATRAGFMKLAEVPDQEIVLGTLVVAPPGWRPNKDKRPAPEDFKALHAPGFAIAAINFRVEDAAKGETVLTTETRVYAMDASTKRKFAAYWRTIYPGSALIRLMWLRAIRHRAEKPALRSAEGRITRQR